MRPIQIQLTYDLSNVGEPSLSPGSRLPDINDYPVVNKAQTEKNFSVSSFGRSVICFHESVNLISDAKCV